jgi:hypothetical protein
MIRHLCILLLLAASARGATNYVNGSSATTVNNALNAASPNDTIILTNSGWSSGTVTMPNSKNITLNGNGLTVSGDFTIPSSPTNWVRVTDFIWASTDVPAITTGDGEGNLPWRMDHCQISGNATGNIMVTGSGPGLIDHLIATNMASYQQMIEPGYNGDTVATNDGWHEVVTPGSSSAIYIEDSVFTHDGSIWDGSCVFQMEYGARVVCRSNILNNVMYEVHGSPGNPTTSPDSYSIGARWWEFYNTYFINGAICIRAGSGLVFNNTGTAQFFVMGEEDADYPSVWQVGRGQFNNLTDVNAAYNSTGVNEVSEPAYVWGNASGVGAPDLNGSGDCAAFTANMVELNRDVFEPTSGASFPANPIEGQGFWRTDLGGNWNQSLTNANDGALYTYDTNAGWTLYYIPYTYPHPLQSAVMGSVGGGGSNAPLSPPSDLKILSVH